MRVIGISGSVGKTSTKECVATVLSQHYNVLKTEGNLNNEVGLPLTILRMRQEHEVAVLEMGISDFGEMTRLSQMAQPDLCLLTNIGQCHLEQLGTRQGILRAKTEMFASMKPGGSICLNADDDLLALVEPYEGASMYYFGSVPPAHGKMPQVYATDIESHGLKGSSCKIHTPGGIIDAQIPLPGEHMVHNALAAALVAGLLGLSREEIAKGLASQVAVSGRSNCLETDKYVIIDDCYNANPVSMKSALDLLALAKGRKVAILGDMYELGANSESLHNEVGSYAASRAELLICVGELSAGIAEGARKMGMQRVMTFATKEEALERFGGILRQGDTILIKASHGMHLEKLVESLTKL